MVERKTPPEAHPPVPSLARWPVLAIAGTVVVVLLMTSGRVGYFDDELYFLAAGRHLAWGYADQGPLVPLLARAMDSLIPGSLVAERLPVTILTAAGVLLTALIARELGGQRRAQVLAAAVFAMGMLAGGHVLTTAAIDSVIWTAATWLLVRWIRTRHDGLLLGLGGLTAAALQNKWLIAGFWLVLGLSAVVVGPWDLLRRPALWLAAAIALIAALPTLFWQSQHGWPQLAMTKVIAHDDLFGGRLTFLPLVLISSGIVLGMVLACYGLWRLLCSPQLRPYRLLGWTVLGLVALFFITNGRSYYVAGLYALCWAAGAVELQRRQLVGWWRWILSWPVYALSAIIALTSLPVLPVSWPSMAKPVSLASLGWPEEVDTVADAYQALPPDRRHTTVVIANWYWDAAAIDRFGPARGLPRAYSAHRGYWYFGSPPDDTDTVLFVGSNPSYLHQFFTEVSESTIITSGPAMNLFAHRVPVWLCSGRHEPWSQLWPRLRHL
jgi:hypothetical protein